MSSNNLQREFEETYARLFEIFAKFDQKDFNRKPAENKWSAGQVAEHLIKANSGFSKMVTGESKDSERNPAEKIGQIKADFLNFEEPMKSPDFILPEDRDFEKTELMNALENVKKEIREAARNADLTKTLTSFEFPGYGFLSGLETLSFVVYHTQRHIHQLEKIRFPI